MANLTKPSTYISSEIKMNAQTGKPQLQAIFMFDDGSGATTLTFASEKYLEFLAKEKGVNFTNGFESVQAWLEDNPKQELHFYQSSEHSGFSLTDAQFISTKNNVAHKMGDAVRIAKVECDDQAVAWHMEDGTVIKRNFTTMIEQNGKKTYFPDVTKRVKLLQTLGMTGDLFSFDMNSMVGGRLSYVLEPAKGNFKEWFKVFDYIAPEGNPFGRSNDVPSESEMNDILNGMGL